MFRIFPRYYCIASNVVTYKPVTIIGVVILIIEPLVFSTPAQIGTVRQKLTNVKDDFGDLGRIKRHTGFVMFCPVDK